MKTFLSTFLVFFISFAHAAVEESCCFCIADTSDRTTTTECQRWLKDNAKKNDCSIKEIIPSHNQVSFPADLSCRKVTAYGANHGLSYFYATVFQFASKASKALNPSELNYDGSTCLVFNNTDVVESEAVKLSHQYPGVNFTLAGNQNTGVVRMIPLPIQINAMKPKEIQQMSSKLIVRAQGGMVEVDYGNCSRPEGRCGFTRQDYGAKNDSNTKFCKQDNDIVIQKCCEPKKGDYGKWSIPGMECEG